MRQYILLHAITTIWEPMRIRLRVTSKCWNRKVIWIWFAVIVLCYEAMQSCTDALGVEIEAIPTYLAVIWIGSEATVTCWKATCIGFKTHGCRMDVVEGHTNMLGDQRHGVGGSNNKLRGIMHGGKNHSNMFGGHIDGLNAMQTYWKDIGIGTKATEHVSRQYG